MLDALLAMNDEIVPELAWQMGRPVRYRRREGRPGGARPLHGGDRRGGAGAARARRRSAGFRRYVKREPVGLVLVIAPWNYPYLTAGNTIFPALMAGNAVLLKHAAQTLLVGERFQQAADKAGLPKGLFQNLVLGARADREADRLGQGRPRQLHRLGRRRQGDRARRRRHLRLARAGARRQGPGLCAAGREARPRDREPRRRRLLQFRPVLLRHRAHLCAREGLRAVPRRLRRL